MFFLMNQEPWTACVQLARDEMYHPSDLLLLCLLDAPGSVTLWHVQHVFHAH